MHIVVSVRRQMYIFLKQCRSDKSVAPLYSYRCYGLQPTVTLGIYFVHSIIVMLIFK